MLNVLIVDDEPYAHEVLKHLCSAHDDLKVVAHCLNAADALKALESGPVDLMFVDIQMPRFGGLDMLRGLDKPPHAVIVSAHKEHALDGFELDVIDYLLKPVSPKRFDSAMDKVRRRIDDERAVKPDDGYLTLKVNRLSQRFKLDEIRFFQGQGNFVKVCDVSGSYLATVTMRQLQEMLPASKFIRVHKSYIVNRNRIAKSGTKFVELDCNVKIPLGRSFRRAIS
ncbi:DNA-binding response regulator [Sphingorhabdus pulchriflava]|uniref:DNA-binding response regulator n=1 Tax=Sphingorhabdus pulchriflava TaxID=2292257 RepID=A0A371BI36_9SPHN|nr:LytTR family DNA-binding domain-containing protein [Sphingorhabdus pulchriflava]RDV07262.1 DNA-binding response regulator [Sphingorhabdus pulchriflava]